jgi:hypothetical protein
MCKEMPVIPVNKRVNPKRIIGKNEGLRRKGTKGLLTPKNDCFLQVVQKFIIQILNS